jgi:hypothetical protein
MNHRPKELWTYSHRGICGLFYHLSGGMHCHFIVDVQKVPRWKNRDDSVYLFPLRPFPDDDLRDKVKWTRQYDIMRADYCDANILAYEKLLASGQYEA